jgi:hypothetical protein
LLLVNAEEQLPADDFQPVTPDIEKNSTMVSFPSPDAVPPFEVIFSNNPNRHSPREDLPMVAEYEQTTLGSMSSIGARVLPDGSPYYDYPQGLKRSGSSGSDRSTGSSTGTHQTRTYFVAGSHHALMAAHQHQNSTGSNNAKRGWVIE